MIDLDFDDDFITLDHFCETNFLTNFINLNFFFIMFRKFNEPYFL